MSVVRVRDIEMAYDDVGSGSPVVLLHGYPFNRSMWREQVDALKSDYRIITPDLRGHGDTTATNGPATMDEMARDVAALLDNLGIERTVLGGISMGGYVTLAFYRRFPLRVRALILADTRPQADTAEARLGREEQAKMILEDGMQSIASEFLKKVLTASTLEREPKIVSRVREMITTTNPRGAAAALRGMADRANQTEFLEGILVPTLILVGSKDQLTPPADSQLMHREIRGSRLEILEGASHLSNLERPEEFNHALKSFLEALQP